jgi:prepilin-type N-terminal cleavage/methylation domain-containing protein
MRGFTILELLVSISLIAIVSIALISAASGLRSTRQVDSATKDVVKTLHIAKQRARNSGSPTAVTFTTSARCFFLTTEQKHCLENGIDWEVTSTLGQREKNQQIIFYQNGSSSGGEVIIGKPKHRNEISVSWLTGAIKVQKR